MPSLSSWFKSHFSKKKVHNGGKYHHGYDGLRHSSYPTTPATIMTYQTQYNHVPPPFAHRQQIYPQELIMQSPPVHQVPQQPSQPQPQFMTTSTNNNITNGLMIQNSQRCHCNQCMVTNGQQSQAQPQMPIINTPPQVNQQVMQCHLEYQHAHQPCQHTHQTMTCNNSLVNQSFSAFQLPHSFTCQYQSKTIDYSCYANMQSLLDNNKRRNESDKYDEHVYYNQRPGLPPYEPPPDYETSIKHPKMCNIKQSGQHITHHSESPVLQKAKDSSYENLRTKSSLYSNLWISKQGPGYTS